MYLEKCTKPVYVRTSKLHGHKAVKGTGDVKDSAARGRIRRAAPSIRTHGKPLRRRGVPKESNARRSHSMNTLRHRRGKEARRREERGLAMARPIILHALRVPEVGLRAYRRDLILVKMDFLLWGWNWTSDAIIQEWDNNGLPKLPGYRGHHDTWKIWDWKKVLGRCADDDGDLTFDSDSVRVTRDEERAYDDLFKHPYTGKNGPLFESWRHGTNGWKTVYYKDLKRRVIALKIMHILRPARTTYVTAWQPSPVKGPKTRTDPLQPNTYHSLGTSSDGRGAETEKPERQLAKRRKVVSDDEEELAHEVRRVDMDLDGARQPRSRARSKKRANRRMVTAEVSDSSVEKTVASIVNTSEVATGKSTRPVEIEGPSGVSIKVPADIPAEPLKEGTELISPISLSSEQSRSAQGEETPQVKMNEDLKKEYTLSEKILEQVVAWIGGTVVEADGITLPTSPVEEVRPEEEKKASGEDAKVLEVTFIDFLQDSVVPLLKYLDGKRERV
ncbi:hypothetical protein AXG93_3410s1100 [Marchantia polymorpha subsp. ruderalis]|uniref:Uncharacterized protein n=1 Tax=Marchantia polymorpha subsp. ruderalis TaxID=1480154 RepID=A0A176W4W6_MARPO|nr:hypothetical protein AXG93_3410s1100 [Marchantia polymorpha subsp. ruderalis]